VLAGHVQSRVAGALGERRVQRRLDAVTNRPGAAFPAEARASLQPRLKACCTPVFIPCPPAGLCACAAVTGEERAAEPVGGHLGMVDLEDRDPMRRAHLDAPGAGVADVLQGLARRSDVPLRLRAAH
jgi:hypothetical protein